MSSPASGGSPASCAGQMLADLLDVSRQTVNAVEAQAASIAKLTSRSDPHAVADYAGALMALDLRAQLPAIRVPVLEIAPYFASDWEGRGISEAGMRAYYQSLLSGVAKLEVVMIAPARHFVMLDQPEAFNEALCKFPPMLAARRS